MFVWLYSEITKQHNNWFFIIKPRDARVLNTWYVSQFLINIDTSDIDKFRKVRFFWTHFLFRLLPRIARFSCFGLGDCRTLRLLPTRLLRTVFQNDGKRKTQELIKIWQHNQKLTIILEIAKSESLILLFCLILFLSILIEIIYSPSFSSSHYYYR